MLTLSGYNFKANIHMYRLQDLNIVLDVNSGAIHILDEVAFELLEKLIECRGNMGQATEMCAREFPASEVADAAEELNSTYQAGALFTEDADIDLDLATIPVKALCLNVAHACNMRCKYCFAGQGSFGLQTALMPAAVGKQALDFLIAGSDGVKNLEVDFFGGEPLLNFDMVKEMVRYGRQREGETGKKFNFTLTTNALWLNEEAADWVIENNIGVILSLDGRREVNDRQRILADGQGSYDTIVPHIKNMVARNPASYYVRGTFTRDNLDFCADVKHLAELGFNHISLEPAVGNSALAIQEADLPRVLQEYEKLTMLLLDYYRQGRDILFFHYNLNLQQGPCLAKRSSGCGAGGEYLVITPNGDIYPCHQFIGEDGFYLGNLSDNHLDETVIDKFRHNRLRDKECRYCWARYFCGGGCHANAFHRNGDMSKPDIVTCTMHKKRIENAIYLDLQKKIIKN